MSAESRPLVVGPESDHLTLKSLITWYAQRGRPVPIEHCLHIAIECCRALTRLDQPNPRWRDISPDTILISRHGEVSLASAPGSGLGSDRRTDVFALGVILWEMLTGGRLFAGETDWRIVDLVRIARVPSLAAENPDVDQELETTVFTALAKKPEHGYRTTADLGTALAHYRSTRRLDASSTLDIAMLVREMDAETDALAN